MSDPDLRDPLLDSAYREAPRDEPSAALDERIRAAARRAVGAGPKAAVPRSPFVRWRVPLSLAATVVLVVTLTLMTREEERRASYEGAPSIPEPIPAQAPQASPPPRVLSKPAETASPPAGRADDRAVRQEAPLRSLEMQKERASPPVTAPSPAAPPRSEAESPAPEVVPAVPAAPAAPVGAGATLGEPKPMSAGPQAPEADRPQQLNRDQPERARREAVSGAIVSRSPEEWIEAIRRLKAQGLDAEAAAELTQFRRRYPDYSLPADLTR